ncbi:protein kinase family protein / WD-40 repeat family protein isoform X2 [Wolffia australiana]
MQAAPDAPLKPSMDIFSLGCAIAELFLNGQPLFEYSQLLAYRRGQYDPCQHLEKITDIGVRKMILHMIQLDPELRLSCESYLQEYSAVVFPCYFSPFLHKFFSCLVPLDSDTRVVVIQSAFHDIYRQMVGSPSSEAASELSLAGHSHGPQATETKESTNYSKCKPRSDEVGKDTLFLKVSSLLKELELGNDSSTFFGTRRDSSSSSSDGINFHGMDQPPQQPSVESLKAMSNVYREKEFPLLKKIQKSDLTLLMSEYNSQLDAYMYALFPECKSNLNCEGMVLISALICSCLRSVKQPQVRRSALLMLLDASLYIDDEDRLQHVLPYVIAMLSDSSAIVRCAALETLSNILPLIRDFPPSDAKIFPEYILPMLSMLPHDQEESVRICYACNIFKIALAAFRFLICSRGLNECQSQDKVNLPTKSDTSPNKERDDIDAQILQLRRSIAEVVQELVMGQKQTPTIRRALLRDIGQLCYFFGQRQSNDFLLPILPAFLNDRDEQLRAIFYGHIVFVCFFVGQRSVEEYLLPYIEQGLSDGMEAVIVNALKCLTMLCRRGFLRKKILLDVIEKAFPLLCYPTQWVRRSIVGFIAACSESLGQVDSHVYLSPVLRPFLHREPTSLSSEASLLSCLKPSVSKTVFHKVLEGTRSSDMLERQRKIWYNEVGSSNQWDVIESTNKVVKEQPKFPDKMHSKTSPSSGGSRSLHTFSSGVDTKDRLSSEKMHFSGFISPHFSAGNSLVSDGQSEGIPVYSVLSETKLQRNSPGASSLSTPMSELSKKQFGLSSSGPSQFVSGPKTMKIPAETFEKDIAGDGASPRSDTTGLPSFPRGSSIPDEEWRPRGVLVAHLQEHRSAVNDISVSVDHNFFVTASDDCTVKIWDTRKLEKDISFRSRLTYPLEGTGNRALCTAMVNGGAQIVAGASSGGLHIFSVDYVSRGSSSTVERYSGVADLKKKDDAEGAVISLLNCSVYDGSRSQTLLYSTQHGGVHLWDTRENSGTWSFEYSPEEGYVSSLALGTCGNWFVSGSSRGVITLWDMRFLLPVNSWKYPTECPIEHMCLFVSPISNAASCGRPWFYVAAGCNEVSLWNAENGSCHQVLRLAGEDNDVENSSKLLPCALRKSPGKSVVKKGKENTSVDSKYRIEEFNRPPPRLSGIRSLLPLPGGNLLTGGTDLKIRFWDHLSPYKSYCICGPSAKGIACDEQYETRSCLGVQLVQETRKQHVAPKLNQKALLAVAAADTAGCHRDSVLSLAAVKMNQRLLISGGRDGAVKVWK